MATKEQKERAAKAERILRAGLVYTVSAVTFGCLIVSALSGGPNAVPAAAQCCSKFTKVLALVRGASAMASENAALAGYGPTLSECTDAKCMQPAPTPAVVGTDGP